MDSISCMSCGGYTSSKLVIVNVFNFGRSGDFVERYHDEFVSVHFPDY